MLLISIVYLICILLSSCLADVQCPDKKSVCADETTCCLLKTGQYGCCPMPKAVCCSDQLHCCPEGTTCDLQQQTCVSSVYGNLPMSKNFLSRVLEVQDVQCDSTGSVMCPDGTTCCKMEGGDWGCCPLPKAVCCQDQVHCCPENTICDIQAQKCDPKSFVKRKRIRWSVKFPAKYKIDQPKDVQCDPDFSCQDNQTCCRLESGDWGCCPMPNAVCCVDKIHCCPEGTTCDLEQETCNQETNGIDRTTSIILTYAKNVKLRDLQCPDPSKTCSDGDTCCKQGNPPSWGCCPLPHAVCCPDYIHCCPKGTKCNNESKCIDELNESRQGALLSAAVVDKKNRESLLFPFFNDIICPDKRSVCQGDRVTCCLMENNQYGCCPYNNGVCCPNKKFCCPQNTSCSLMKDKCVANNGVTFTSASIESSPLPVEMELPLFKMSTKGKIPEAKWSTCQNSLSKCLDSTTCCQTSDGNYGCCPHREGQCCSDGQHCCPKGTTCDLASMKCILENGKSFEWSTLINNQTNEAASMCSDSLHSCKMGGKCCKNMLGYYSCCPDPQGVCCSSGLSCCPKGYLCNSKSGTCTAVTRNDDSLN